MARMKIHNDRNAPEKSLPTLKIFKEAKGRVPNLLGVGAASPILLQAMSDMFAHFRHTSLEIEETELVILAACREYGNACALEYQSYMAREEGVADHVIESVREKRPGDEPWQDERYNALWAFVVAVIATGGAVEDDEVKAFKKAGFSDEHMLEVLIGIHLASLFSHVARLAQLKPDPKFRWHSAGIFPWRRK